MRLERMTWRLLDVRSNQLSYESWNCVQKVFERNKSEEKGIHLPGIEPEAAAWKAAMLPLHQRCLWWSYLESNQDYRNQNPMW